MSQDILNEVLANLCSVPPLAVITRISYLSDSELVDYIASYDDENWLIRNVKGYKSYQDIQALSYEEIINKLNEREILKRLLR